MPISQRIGGELLALCFSPPPKKMMPSTASQEGRSIKLHPATAAAASRSSSHAAAAAAAAPESRPRFRLSSAARHGSSRRNVEPSRLLPQPATPSNTDPSLTSFPYRGHLAHPTASQRLELTSTIPSDFLECWAQNIGFPPGGPKKGLRLHGSSAHHRGDASADSSARCSNGGPAMVF